MPIVPTDPYYASTVLHLPCDRDLQDYSAELALVTVTGHAQLVSAPARYGGGAVSFDGAGDRLSTTLAQPWGTGDFTVEFWVYPQNGGHGQAWARLFQLGANATAGGLWLVAEGNAYPMRLIVEACQSAPTYVRLLDATATIPNGQWTHVALVRSNGTYTLYQNGQVAGSSTVTAGANLTQSTVYLGANESAGESFLGTLDDVRITRGVARYTAAFTPPGAIPTVDWYAPAVIAGQVSLLPPGTTFAPYPPAVAAPVPQREDRLLAGGRHLYFGGRGRIAGTVQEKGTPDRPVARRVRLFRDLDAHCVGETWSDSVTGSYGYILYLSYRCMRYLQ